MNIEPRTKLKIILGCVAAVTVFEIINPFIINSGIGQLSREFTQGTLAILGFLIVAYLWKKFNNLRKTMDKKEHEDEILSEIEMNVQKATHKKI
jgi:hypothetical protein